MTGGCDRESPLAALIAQMLRAGPLNNTHLCNLFGQAHDA